MKSLTVAIPTFNRKMLVELCAKSISNANNNELVNYFILDDASTDFDVNYLKSIFPPNSQILRNDINSGGADFAAYNLLTNCVKKNTDLILILDSDMILASNFYEIICHAIEKTEGFLSIFNTKSHAAVEERGIFLVKNSVGCAGSLMTTELAKKIIENVRPGPSFDFRFCKFLRDQGIKILCLNNSIAQHLGYLQGQNSSGVYGDIGLNFYDNKLENIYLMIEFLMKQVQIERSYAQEKYAFKYLIRRLFKKISA